MEDILFDNYRKFQKDYTNPIKNFNKFPWFAIVLMILLVSSGIFSILTLLIDCLEKYSIYGGLSELLVCFIIYIYSEHFQIFTSKTRLHTYQNYCFDVLSWLKSLGVIATKENLSDLQSRLIAKRNSLEKKRIELQKRLEKWAQVLVVPIVLVVFTAVINKQTDLSTIIHSTLLLLTILIIFIVIIIGLSATISLFSKRKLEQLNSFADDLQGILDTQFENKLIEVKEETTTDPVNQEKDSV